MDLGTREYITSASAFVLMLSVLALVFRNHYYRVLPIFTAYLCLATLRQVAVFLSYWLLGYTSEASFYVYWSTQGLMLAMRALVIGEICWICLRHFRGVWGLAWRLLGGTAILLAAVALASSYGKSWWIAEAILVGERGLELAEIVILVGLLTICRYYMIPVLSATRWIALGLICYSSLQIINNSFLHSLITASFQMWNLTRMLSFQLALLIWCVAVWRPLAAPEGLPMLLDRRAYDTLMPQVSYRLRELNARLLEMLRQ